MVDSVGLLVRSAEDGSPGEVQASENYVSPEEREIEEIANRLRVRIKIIGCGGAGSNTISRLAEEGVTGADLIAINTDASHLLEINAPKKMLIGKNKTRGLGTGAIPSIGEEAAIEDLPNIQKIVQRCDIVFVTCGLGGGTGTGAAPVVAKAAKDANALVISTVTLPFTSEGRIRMENALQGLEKLSQYSDTLIAIPNDLLLKHVPKKPLDEAFAFSDRFLGEAMKGLTEMITQTGEINIDYADVKTVMKDGGVALIGIGEVDGGDNRALRALEMAISSPLIDTDISDARGCIIRIVGGSITLAEAETATREIQRRINKDANIILGTAVDPSMGSRLRVLLLLTGVKSPYMIKTLEDAKNLRKMLVSGEDETPVDIVK
ncbi:cell division protein FtsZ [Thermogymnomonas acidicola]|uniref:Cell division protein FtsZ n=1 Tax=Thermogymnomonas acidicola TaxID=399579 RepID=A0AA37F8Z9_9ARCH|nr:cell division protein FtsZ [Thermogymnomonas acidicola]GGM70054.1 cell division protein FtsZ [Thermogymnomonas acidicola]